jgi:choline dehydrogenase-like flavoprotein
MAFIAASKTAPDYDVIIVGSGAAGGQVAYTLAMEGAKVLMLEAGRNYDPTKETPMFRTDFEAPLRGAATPDKPFGFYDATVDGGWDVPGEPYTNASTDPREQFQWWRARMLGGRTNHWGRHSFRNGPYDFKGRTRDGVGFDWPLTYDELAPYYDRVEMLIGVCGSNEGLENTPDSPPGVLLPPPPLRAGERLAQFHGRRMGIPVVPIHRAVLTRAQDADTIPAKLHPHNERAQRILAQAMRSRAACIFATPCLRGCAIKANYQSPTVHLPPALATGNLDILPLAMAREILVNDAGRATGVSYIDKTTGQEQRAAGRVVVLAAGSAESARLLLNSRSARFPQGVANSSGLVGRYIMDTVGASVFGQVPRLENLPPQNEDGAGGLHAYVPWWLHRQQLAGELNFPRGYHIEFSTGREAPEARTLAAVTAMQPGSYGRRLKADARRYYGSFVAFTCRGEMVPNENSYCEIDPGVKDRWGIPVLRFHWKWSDYEIRQVEHMQRTFSELLVEMGGRVLRGAEVAGRDAIHAGGNIIHEVGGTIMGSDRAKSVTNGWGQTWDVKNLFVADGGTFCSNADKNPTLTIMALAWRSADYLLAELRKGNL